MSLPKKARNFRASGGNKFPDEASYDRFAPAIAAALRAEFGGTNASVKTVVRLTGANQRTVRNWLEGKNGPGGDNLVALIRHSDTVLRALLTLSDRRGLAVASHLRSIHTQMKSLVDALDDLHSK